MLSKIAIAGAMLASLTLPGLAASGHGQLEGEWSVLQDAGGAACYVANRAPVPDEARLSGGFATEQEAVRALANIAVCESVNIEHDKGSAQSNSS
jgi:hypothetical protein